MIRFLIAVCVLAVCGSVQAGGGSRGCVREVIREVPSCQRQVVREVVREVPSCGSRQVQPVFVRQAPVVQFGFGFNRGFNRGFGGRGFGGRGFRGGRF